MEKLSSIQEALKLFGSPCIECRPYSWDSKYTYVKRENGSVVYVCSKMGHKHRLEAGFETSREEILGLAGEIQNLAKTKPTREASRTERETFNAQLKSLIDKKLAIYALFFPRSLEMEFDGICYLCLEEAPIQIREREVRIGCSSCASIMMDSISA